MTRKLFEMANRAAEDEGLVYAPDSAAMSWMRKFSKMIAVAERERCARLCEEAGHKDIAATIRKGEE
jgi:hypothetical protein